RVSAVSEEGCFACSFCLCGTILRTLLARLGARAANPAEEYDVVRRFRLLINGRLNSGTDARPLHLSCKQCQRSPPIRALLGGNASDGVVRRNVEPSRFAIDEEEIFFRRLVFPTHFARAAKIDNTCFRAQDAAVLSVALEKRRLQRPRRAIPGLQPGDDILRDGNPGL